AAHAAGNVAFALIAGPAMVRMLARFRQRFEWRTPALAVTLLAALLLVPSALPDRALAASGEVEQAASWLESEQSSDGGFGASPRDSPSAARTGGGMLGLEAAGRTPFDVARLGRSPIDFLRGHLDELSSPGDLARTIVALQGAGVDPRSFASHNLIAELLEH